MESDKIYTAYRPDLNWVGNNGPWIAWDYPLKKAGVGKTEQEAIDNMEELDERES